jgi:hypothetical protein
MRPHMQIAGVDLLVRAEQAEEASRGFLPATRRMS